MAYPIIYKDKDSYRIITDEPKVYPITDILSIKMLPKLKEKSLVIGFIGPRGAGKSLNMARLAVTDHLLKCRKVWSNMDIGIRMHNKGNIVTSSTEPMSKLQLRDLDELYSDGCLVIDEINMEVAEARRSQSGDNLTINYIVQQLRKRRLDFLWSAQSEMHVDSRLRWQTDIFVKCTDVSMTHGPGELSRIEVYDYSGIYLGKSPISQHEALMFSTILRNKPWWNIYNTWQLQGIDDDEELQEQEGLSDEVIRCVEKVKRVIDQTEDGKVSKYIAYQIFGANDKKAKERVAEILGMNNIILHPSSRYFILSDISELIEA